jgi:hypothetical protein
MRLAESIARCVSVHNALEVIELVNMADEMKNGILARLAIEV